MNRESKNLILPTLKMAVATFLSRILGLLREQVMAFYFGAGGMTDAFLVAYRIPNLMRDLFAEGAFSSALVPVFTEKMQKDPQGARSLLWTVFVCLLGLTGAISLGIMLTAPHIVNVFAPRFSETPEKFQLTVLMVRIMAPFLTLVSLAALFMGALHSLRVFFIPTLAPAVFNIIMVFTIVLAGTQLPWWKSLGLHPILIVALGVCLGGLMQGIIQFPLLLFKKMGPTLKLNFYSVHVKKIFKKLGPGLLGLATTQINLIVNTALATSTVMGAVSWLSFAFRLFQFPVGIIGVSVANSNLVLFSDAWKRGERTEALATLKKAIHFALFLLLPSSALLWALSLLMVQIIFERGKFDAEDSFNTANALRLYALGLPFYGLYKIFVPVFYTLDQEKIPVLTSIISVAFNIVFCILLVPSYGFEVLAMGMSLSIFLNVLIQGLVLKRSLHCPGSTLLPAKIVKMALSAVLCAGAVRIGMSTLNLATLHLSERMIALILYTILGLVSYGAALMMMGEGGMLERIVKKFFN